MGEAKKRGTYEERKAAAVAFQELQEKVELERRRLLALETPDQKRQKTHYLASLLGLVGGMS
jgi:hypothetical protein